jgi:2-polyprenyl-3-methyl-5-hydroxy-6-metoxy-1,4-benzoquinol methylase
MEREELRSQVRRLVSAARMQGRPCDWFESLYRDSDGSIDRVPWARHMPNSHFLKGMDRPEMPCGGRALVPGCGFGNDAEELATRGFDVTAFDVSRSAIEWCGKKHSETSVQYEVQDLFRLPEAYREAFDVVVEVYTLQAIPLPERTAGFGPMADCVAPGGVLFAVVRGRNDGDRVDGDGPPWAISRAECAAFEASGLVLERWEDFHDDEDPPNRRFRMRYRRPLV